jgi:hypothetical protein
MNKTMEWGTPNISFGGNQAQFVVPATVKYLPVIGGLQESADEALFQIGHTPTRQVIEVYISWRLRDKVAFWAIVLYGDNKTYRAWVRNHWQYRRAFGRFVDWLKTRGSI